MTRETLLCGQLEDMLLFLPLKLVALHLTVDAYGFCARFDSCARSCYFPLHYVVSVLPLLFFCYTLSVLLLLFFCYTYFVIVVVFFFLFLKKNFNLCSIVDAYIMIWQCGCDFLSIISLIFLLFYLEEIALALLIYDLEWKSLWFTFEPQCASFRLHVLTLPHANDCIVVPVIIILKLLCFTI